MATKKKMLQAAAGNAGGAGLDITDVFSTYLYTGDYGNTLSTRTIQNGIDLAGEGGMVWVKGRAFGSVTNNVYHNHYIDDTERGADNLLSPNLTDAAGTVTNGVLGFNSDGFDAGFRINISTGDFDYSSWTFRKAPKFFDVVTYTGDTSSSKQIAHNLGSVPGSIFIKRTDDATNWLVYHKDIPGSNGTGVGFLKLNTTDNDNVNSNAFPTQPTSTHFTVNANYGDMNASGATYVAYLFAHNNGDGEFGPDGDQDIIKCGSYSQSSASDVDVDLGFEPQFVIVKRSDDTSQWYILDEMRGFLAGSNSTSSRTLYASLANAEADFTIQKTATGFTWPSGQYGSGTQEYIYIAIRRGPLAQPESGTEVFAIDTRSDATSNPPSYSANGIVDMALQKELNASGWGLWDRLRGQYRLQTHLTNAEDGPFSYANFDHMDGWGDIGATDTTHSWMWKRAPGFFDVVAYTGNATAGRTVPHNLGVAPELMIAKTRDAANYWVTYDAASGPTKFMILNQTNGTQTSIDHWNNTAPTASVFTLGDGNYTNRNATQHIIYLFASLPGISKVGSYTSNGSQLNIDCGFSSGARFVLIKRTSGTGGWFVWDSDRGITASNDPYLQLQSTGAEGTDNDVDIEPYSSGFTVNYGNAGINNLTGETYIFYAIA